MRTAQWQPLRAAPAAAIGRIAANATSARRNAAENTFKRTTVGILATPVQNVSVRPARIVRESTGWKWTSSTPSAGSPGRRDV